MKTYRPMVVIALLVGIGSAALCLVPQIVSLEQFLGLRWLSHLRGPLRAPQEVVLVALNGKVAANISLPREAERFHRCEDLRIGAIAPTHVALSGMPARWPRCLHTRLVDKLLHNKPRAIVFDMLFRDRPPMPGFALDLNSEQDIGLAAAIQRAGQVLIAQKLETVASGTETDERLIGLARVLDSAALGAAPFPVVDSADKRFDEFLAFAQAGWATPSLPTLAVQAYTLDAYPDFRALLMNAAPALALYLPADAAEIRKHGNLQAVVLLIRQIFAADAGLAERLRSTVAENSPGLSTGNRESLNALIDLYGGGDVRLLNYFGPAGTVLFIGFDKVLAMPEADAMSMFGGKAVFVGYAEFDKPEQVEHFHTVFSSTGKADLSGVEIAATAFANMLHRTTIVPASRNTWLTLAFASGFVSAMMCLLLSYRTAIPIVGVLVSGYGATVLFLFSRFAIWYPLLVPMFVAAPLGVGSGLLWKYHVMRQQRERMRWALGQFIPNDVVIALEQNAGNLGKARESLECACVATDAANFTGLAEILTPEALAAFLNEYFEALFRPVAKYGGFVSDVVGDALLAIWPHRTPDTHSNVCLALLEMREAARIFQEKPTSHGLLTRFGMDWGRIALGTIGAHGHYEYRAVGDAVNTANRIQELNKKLGTRILVSRPALADGQDFLVRDVGRFILRGKQMPVDLCELLGPRTGAPPEDLILRDRFESALQLLRTENRTAAIDQLGKLALDFPGDGPTAFYLSAMQSGAPLHGGALRIT